MDVLIDIARRKERLIARCAAQRETIAEAFRELRKPIAVADRALAAARFLGAHPVLVLAAVAGVVALRRRKVLSLVTSGLTAWRMWRAIAAWANGIGLDLLRGRRPEKR
jgi:glutathione S-transferase